MATRHLTPSERETLRRTPHLRLGQVSPAACHTCTHVNERPALDLFREARANARGRTLQALHLARVALPNARLVVDRFHLAQKLSFALSQARRAIQKVAPPDVKAALKGVFWLLVKNRENRTAWLERTQASGLQAWRTLV